MHTRHSQNPHTPTSVWPEFGKKNHAQFDDGVRDATCCYSGVLVSSLYFSQRAMCKIITSTHLLETWLPCLVLRRDVIKNKNKNGRTAKPKGDFFSRTLANMIHSLFCLESLQNSSLWQAFTTLKCLYNETDEYREGWEELRGGESHGEDAFFQSLVL